jgi:probable phosphoglycerate mutase
MNGDLFDDAPESLSGWYTAHCDGGSRGNPGPAGFGAVIEGPDGRLATRLSHFLGIQTNNFAEYSALLAVLEWAIKHEVRRLRVISDSELMVRQIKGQYKVSNAGLRPLWEEARRRAGWLERFEIRHTLRGGNQEADRLANEAMDRGMGKSGDQGLGAMDQGSGTGDQGSGAMDQGSGVRDQGSANRLHAVPRRGSGVARPGSAGAGAGEQANRQNNGNKPEPRTLSGYVKNGMVHLLDGELPDGVFVKVTPE